MRSAYDPGFGAWNVAWSAVTAQVMESLRNCVYFNPEMPVREAVYREVALPILELAREELR